MKRLQFELPDERVKELDELLERTGLKTRVNLFNHALTLFEWAVRERESGRIITSMDEETSRYKELEMPGLPHKKARAQELEEARASQRPIPRMGGSAAMKVSEEKRGARIYRDLDNTVRRRRKPKGQT